MTFEGEHRPPDMGRTTVPLPVIGKGAVELSADALVVRGTRRAGAAGLIFLMVLAVIGVMIAVGVALASAGFSSKAAARGVALAGIGSGFLGLALVRKRQAAKSSEPLELKFPWDQVRKGDHDPEHAGAVLIHVKRSLLNTESLHFAPDGGPHELVKALAERIKR